MQHNLFHPACNNVWVGRVVAGSWTHGKIMYFGIAYCVFCLDDACSMIHYSCIYHNSQGKNNAIIQETHRCGEISKVREIVTMT